MTRNRRDNYDSIHGTFKAPGNGSYSIENCGEGCHVVITKEGDNARHPPYDDQDQDLMNDSELDVEVKKGLRG